MDTGKPLRKRKSFKLSQGPFNVQKFSRRDLQLISRLVTIMKRRAERCALHLYRTSLSLVFFMIV